MTKTEQNILDHLSPVEYGLYHDTYLCGVSIENKNHYMYTMRDKVSEWVEKNGGKFIVLSEKVICHNLNKKGFVVQTLIDMLKSSEYPTAIKIATEMCEQVDIDTGEVINKANMVTA